MTQTPITPLRMPPDLKAEAREQAKKEGILFPQLVYKAIKNYLNQTQ